MTAVGTALERIAGDLDAIAGEIAAGHPVDPELIEVAARRLRVQAETLEKGLDQ